MDLQMHPKDVDVSPSGGISERFNRKCPVGICCHQCEHWWLHLFSSKAKMQTNPTSSAIKLPTTDVVGSFILWRLKNAFVIFELCIKYESKTDHEPRKQNIGS